MLADPGGGDALAGPEFLAHLLPGSILVAGKAYDTDANLVDKAKKLGIPVWKVGGA